MPDVVTIQTTTQQVLISEPGPAGRPGVIVSPINPGLTTPGLWVQTGLGPTGQDMTIWIEDGT